MKNIRVMHATFLRRPEPTHIGIAAILLGIAFIAFFSGSMQRRIETSTKGIRLAATIFPLYDIARNIVGERGEVALILPPGASEHTFELTPADVKKLAGVRTIFKVGVADDWVDPVLSSIPNARVLTTIKNISLRRGDDDEHEPREASYDPHYWLTLKNGIIIAGTIAEELIALDSDGAAYYQERLTRYRNDLAAAEKEIRNTLTKLKSNKIIVFHDAWAYFADSYGLEIVAMVEPSGGKEATPANLREITAAVKKYQLDAIFLEPQLSPDIANALINDLGLRTYVLDPVGGIETRDSYIALMRYNASVVADALGLRNR